MKQSRLLTVGCALLLIHACSKTPLTGSKGLHLLPESTLIAQSGLAYQEMVKQKQQANAILDDTNEGVLVKEVADNLIDATERYLRQTNNLKAIAGFQWEVHLLDDEVPNAFCMPGGMMIVNSGILPIARDPSGLAIILGHEIGHALAQHGNARVSQGILATVGAGTVAVATANQDYQTREIVAGLYGLTAQYAVMMPFGRKHELEADEIGVYLAAMAGYDPAEGPKLWERMAQLGGKTPAFLSTHPSDEKRAQRLRDYQPAARNYAAQYGLPRRESDSAIAFGEASQSSGTTKSPAIPTSGDAFTGGARLKTATPSNAKTPALPAEKAPPTKPKTATPAPLPPLPTGDPFAGGSHEGKALQTFEGPFRSNAPLRTGTHFKVQLHVVPVFDPTLPAYQSLLNSGQAISVEYLLDRKTYRVMAGSFDTHAQALSTAKQAMDLKLSPVAIVRYQDNDRAETKYQN